MTVWDSSRTGRIESVASLERGQVGSCLHYPWVQGSLSECRRRADIRAGSDRQHRGWVWHQSHPFLVQWPRSGATSTPECQLVLSRRNRINKVVVCEVIRGGGGGVEHGGSLFLCHCTCCVNGD